MVNKKVFASRLRDAREGSYTRADLAQRVGVGYNSLRSWENPDKDVFPNTRFLPGLCTLLNISADELLNIESHIEVHNENNIRWRISRIHPGSNFANREVAIRIFNLIMKEGLRPEDIRLNDLDLETTDDDNETYNGATLPFNIPGLIERLLLSKIIQIVDVPNDPERERAILDKYPNLKYCVVAKLDHVLHDSSLTSQTIRRELMAFLAVERVVGHFTNANSIGLIGGRVISRFCDFIPPYSLSGFQLVSILHQQSTHSPEQLSSFLTGNDLVAKLVSLNPDIVGLKMPFINYERRNPQTWNDKDGYEVRELENAYSVLMNAQNVEIVLMSVGSVNTNIHVPYASSQDKELRRIYSRLNKEDQERCKGDILRRFVDDEGNRIGNEDIKHLNDAFVYSISLGDLRNIAQKDNGQVWIMATRHEKVPVIRGALISGLANCLVIENSIADGLLD